MSDDTPTKTEQTDEYEFVGQDGSHTHNGERLSTGDVVVPSAGELAHFGHKFAPVADAADSGSGATQTPDPSMNDRTVPEPQAVSEPSRNDLTEPTDSNRDLESINGIGPATADSLRDADIETVSDARSADPETLIEAGVRSDRAEEIANGE